MPGGLRLRTMVFAFPFFERGGFPQEDCDRRIAVVTEMLGKLPFVTNVNVDIQKLRDPLHISVNPHHHKLQDRSIEDIEKALERFLEKIYNFRQCL